MNNTEYYEWIDALKVVTMLLVIIGHCGYLIIDTKYGGTSYSHVEMGNPSLIYITIEFLVKFIYTFHMPLFMAISGMCFSFSLKKWPSIMQLVNNKVHRLLFPFIGVTILYSVPIKYFSGYYDYSDNILHDIFAGQLLLMGNSHLWYVVSLFEIFIMYSIIERYNIPKNKWFWITLLLISWVGRRTEAICPFLGIGGAMKHLFFFALGFNYFSKLNTIDILSIKKPLLGLLFTLALFFTNTQISKFGLSGKVIGYFLFTLMAVIGGGAVLCW